VIPTSRDASKGLSFIHLTARSHSATTIGNGKCLFPYRTTRLWALVHFTVTFLRHTPPDCRAAQPHRNVTGTSGSWLA
jgi:hypothetical protein